MGGPLGFVLRGCIPLCSISYIACAAGYINDNYYRSCTHLYMELALECSMCTDDVKVELCGITNYQFR